jgi:hypothetical protein
MRFAKWFVPVALALSALGLSGCPSSEGVASDPLENAASRLFESRLVYKVAGQAVDVAVGDLNGDNIPDLATVNRDTNNVSVLLGKSDGNYAAAVNYPAGALPSAIAAVDLVGSGKLDLVTTNETYDQVIVLPGVGDGTFGEGRTFGLVSGSKPRAVAVADVNGDGKLDIITADSASNTLTVLLGKGNYTYADPVRFAVGAGPRWVLARDVNGDGACDLISVNRDSNDVSLLINTGGSFAAPVILGCGTTPRMAVLADFTGDGKADLLVSNAGSGDFSLLAGQGGGFAAETRIDLGYLPTRMAAADFNRDGKTDLAAILFESAEAGALGVVAVLSGDGAGGFGAPQFFGACLQGYGLDAADMNADTKVDLVVADAGNSTVSVLRGRGNGRFESDQRFPVGANPRVAVIEDFNKDGKADLAVGNYDGNNVVILLGDGTGQFTADPAPLALAGKPRAMAAGDLNKDGRADLVVGVPGTPTLAVFLGQGTGRFTPTLGVLVLPAGSIYSPEVQSLALGDMNGDGNLDVVTGNSGSDSISVLLGDGTGKFAAPIEFPKISYPLAVRLADLNHDSKLDVVCVSTRNPDQSTDKAEPRVVSIFGVGDGTLDAASMVRYTTGSGPSDMVLGAFSSTGVPDAMTVQTGDDSVYLSAGTADGRFGAGKRLRMDTAPIGVLPFDFNGDGLADVVATHYGNFVSVRLSRGAGKFELPNHFLTGSLPNASVIGDVTGDGVPDLITLDKGTSSVSVLIGHK